MDRASFLRSLSFLHEDPTAKWPPDHDKDAGEEIRLPLSGRHVVSVEPILDEPACFAVRTATTTTRPHSDSSSEVVDINAGIDNDKRRLSDPAACFVDMALLLLPSNDVGGGNNKLPPTSPASTASTSLSISQSPNHARNGGLQTLAASSNIYSSRYQQRHAHLYLRFDDEYVFAVDPFAIKSIIVTPAAVVLSNAHHRRRPPTLIISFTSCTFKIFSRSASLCPSNNNDESTSDDNNVRMNMKNHQSNKDKDKDKDKEKEKEAARALENVLHATMNQMKKHFMIFENSGNVYYPRFLSKCNESSSSVGIFSTATYSTSNEGGMLLQHSNSSQNKSHNVNDTDNSAHANANDVNNILIEASQLLSESIKRKRVTYEQSFQEIKVALEFCDDPYLASCSANPLRAADNFTPIMASAAINFASAYCAHEELEKIHRDDDRLKITQKLNDTISKIFPAPARTKQHKSSSPIPNSQQMNQLRKKAKILIQEYKIETGRKYLGMMVPSRHTEAQERVIG